MKRSEFKKWLDGGLRYGFSDDPEETIVKKFEEMFEEQDEIPWEPEGEPDERAVRCTMGCTRSAWVARTTEHAAERSPFGPRFFLPAAELAADALTAAGVEWEPEEPGLPKRLVLKRLTHEQAFQEDGWRDGDIPWLIPDGEPWWTKAQMFAGFEAALAAYNSENRYMRVVERALAEVRRPATTFERILAILEEREPETEAPTRPGDVISKTRQGVTVHYAIGPVRATREEAERDLRLFQEH